ncbi:hypothetical protein AR546_15090 [Leptospira interrogans serovar Canicola]|nr:hypothetical protein B2G47_14365 [Leptospira interrogans serovar Canicola]KGE25850.1 hypothetical protein IQ65_13105 [Leptospira interrogans serovar Lai]KYZ61408.1 hypothetical protein AWU66_05560 [Leptospira interrogans serovar Pomona]OQM30936.1 hypothetical protein DV38_07935 [Leptospira interrogans]OQM31703.1 hypothetical protein DV30_07525 [Leptospira interrogans serovar Canicola str. Gui44]
MNVGTITFRKFFLIFLHRTHVTLTWFGVTNAKVIYVATMKAILSFLFAKIFLRLTHVKLLVFRRTIAN